ncbi:MAG TPA: ATP-binding cassette domain-containing protein, partial [Myxococcota bacterium]
MSGGTALAIERLSVSFAGVRVVDDVSIVVPRGKTVGLVGESGSGKSVTALSILRLNGDARDGAVVEGRVQFGDRDLLALSEKDLRAVRGNRIAMVFQDPMTSLNPVLTVGEQVAEVVRLHEHAPRKVAWQ